MSSSLPPQEKRGHTATTNDQAVSGSSLHWLLPSPTPQDAFCRYAWGKPLIWGGILLAFGCCALLLFNTLFSPILGSPWSTHLWAVPLLLMSLVTLFFLFVSRLSWRTFFNLLFIGVALLFWGIDLLLPSGWLIGRLYDVVIVCFVLIAAVTLLARLLPVLRPRSEEKTGREALAPSAAVFGLRADNTRGGISQSTGDEP